jgi:Peptidase A4 family
VTTKRLVILCLAPFCLVIGLTCPATAQRLRVQTLSIEAPCQIGGTCTSSNWAGYVATGRNGRFTVVRGHWTVQRTACSESGTASYSEWVGLDGFDSGDLLQTGTAVHCTRGRSQMVAWWEAVPILAEQDEFRVSPGDQIDALVRYASATGVYHLRLLDDSLGRGLRAHGACPTRSCPNDSAEWIVEREVRCTDPTDPSSCHLDQLADFRTARFTQSVAGSSTRSTRPIGTFRHTRFNVRDSADRVLMSTSRLDATGAAFSVAWHRSA